MTAQSFADALKAAAKAATPGPWDWTECGCGFDGEEPTDPEHAMAWGHHGPDLNGRDGGLVITSIGYDQDSVVIGREDAALIVLLRNAAPELIAVLEAATEVVAAPCELDPGGRSFCQHGRWPCEVEHLRVALDAVNAKAQP